MRKLLNAELDRKSIDEFKQSNKTPIIIVLDNVRSLNNVGSVFRTADAFLLEAVYLCGITGCPPNKEIQKTSNAKPENKNRNIKLQKNKIHIKLLYQKNQEKRNY